MRSAARLSRQPSRQHQSSKIKQEKLNRRPDSRESLDARAALPQNCSPTKLIAGTAKVNSTYVPELTHRCANRATGRLCVITRVIGGVFGQELEFLGKWFFGVETCLFFRDFRGRTSRKPQRSPEMVYARAYHLLGAHIAIR